MSGWNGQANLNRNSGNVTVNLGIWGMSPGLEVNDAGYSTQTDRAGAHAMVQYPEADARPVDQRADLLGVEVVDVELGLREPGRRLAGVGDAPGSRTCGGHRSLLTYAKRVWDDKLTRGGPTVIRPGNRGVQLGLATDSRRKAVVSLGAQLHPPRLRRLRAGP